MDSSNQFSTSSLVNGKAYAHDYTTPTPGNINTASLNMGAAYSDATGRATDVLDAGACVTGTCDLAGTTLTPGVYTFTAPGNVNITNDMYLSGNSSGVWIFQIPGNLDISSAKSIILSGGAQASNIFWAVAGTTTLEAGSTFEGNILAGPSTSTIAMQSGAVLNGRALGQTNVSLIGNTVAIPDLVPVPSSNTTLSNLTISSGTLSPVFTPTTYIYADSVPNSVSSVNVTPTVGEAHATVTVNAIPVTSGSASVSLPLNVGPNTISIVVTAQNASIQQYIIIVNRTPISNGGGSSSGGGYITYGCKDPNALNYNAYSTSEPSLCQYATVTTPTVTTPTPTVTTAPTTTSVTSTSTASQAGYIFTQTLRYGMRNEQVMNLQKILNEDSATQIATTGAGSPGHETTYFGLATKAAVMKFQKKNGLTADGIVGPKTIKELKMIENS
jgi:hypothetical protein